MRRSHILPGAWCGVAAHRCDQDVSPQRWSDHFQPSSGPEVSPGLAWGITYPHRPPEGPESLSNDGGEEAWSTLRSIVPLKPDLGLENGWMQPSAIFCDCIHQGKPFFSSFFFLLRLFRRFSGNEQRVKVPCYKTAPQITVDLRSLVIICLFPLKLKRSPLWSSVQHADVEANCAKKKKMLRWQCTHNVQTHIL